MIPRGKEWKVAMLLLAKMTRAALSGIKSGGAQKKRMAIGDALVVRM
jgi:hypothetical protein